MKTVHLKSILGFLFILLIGFSCSKDKEVSNQQTPRLNEYSGSGSYGDLITFSINPDDQTYVVTNETTGLSNEGSYEIMESDFEGIYKVTSNGSTFYGVELTDKIIAANFPTGNIHNDISFGISKTINNIDNPYIEGDYVWVSMKSNEHGELYADTETGLINFNNDGTWFAGEFDARPDEYDVVEPIFSGSWSIDEIDTEKMNFLVNDIFLYISGFMYATADAGISLVDLGMGNGFLLGYKLMETTIEDVVGNYKFIDVTNTGAKGAGSFKVDALGNVTFDHIDNAGNTVSGSFSNLSRIDKLPNVYVAKNVEVNGLAGDIYLVIIDDFIMYFIADENALISYGAGGEFH